MESPSARAPPPDPPFEARLLSIAGFILVIAGAFGFLFGLLGVFVTRDIFTACDFMGWSIAAGVVGCLLRAVAGIWSALERIAHRLDDPVSDEPVRRALLGIWETLTKK